MLVKEIDTKAGKNIEEVELSIVAKGIYLVKLGGDSYSTTKTVVVN